MEFCNICWRSGLLKHFSRVVIIGHLLFCILSNAENEALTSNQQISQSLLHVHLLHLILTCKHLGLFSAQSGSGGGTFKRQLERTENRNGENVVHKVTFLLSRYRLRCYSIYVLSNVSAGIYETVPTQIWVSLITRMCSFYHTYCEITFPVFLKWNTWGETTVPQPQICPSTGERLQQ